MFDILLIILAFATGANGSSSGGPTAAAAPEPPKSVAAQDPAPNSGGSSEELPPGAVVQAEPEPKPLPYEAEQQVATGRFTTAVEVKPILGATRASWIAVREFNGQDLVYVTQIWSWRCGLVALHYGVNGDPLEPWPLPDCHETSNSPNAMLPDDGLPYRSYPLGSIDTVTVELIYDDLSQERATFNRHGAMIP